MRGNMASDLKFQISKEEMGWNKLSMAEKISALRMPGLEELVERRFTPDARIVGKSGGPAGLC
jgi:hypothetical protein